MQRKNDQSLPSQITYQQKYEQLKNKLKHLYQFRQGNYHLTPDTLLINTESLDKALAEGQKNYMQAYFNLLNTCYEHVKNGSVSMSIKTSTARDKSVADKPENDIILLPKLPEQTDDKYELTSIITPDGLYQMNPGDKGLIGAKNFKPYLLILTKEELGEIGMGEYLEESAKSKTETHKSIKEQLTENDLIYKLDEKVLGKRTVSANYHTGYITRVGELSLEIDGQKQRTAPQSNQVMPAPKILNGRTLNIGFEIKDVFSSENIADQYLVQLFDEISFLGKKAIEDFKALMSHDAPTHSASDLIRHIEMAIYNHAKSHPKDKARCYEILDAYLRVKENNGEEYEFIGQSIFSKEEYVSYKMEQMKLDQTSYSAVDRMIALLVESERPVIMNFRYNIKANDKNLKKEGKIQSLVALFSDGENTYYTPNLETVEGTNFYNLIKEKNPELVKAIHVMYQDPATSKETKTALNTLLTDLLEYERDIKILLADAELVKDISIANATKYAYCTEIKNKMGITRQRIEDKYNDLNRQVEVLFPDEKENKTKLQIKGAILTILGVGLIVLGIALALFVAPLAGLVAGAGGLAIGTGIGFFYKAGQVATTYDNTSKLISEIKEFGEKTAKEILDEKLDQVIEETPDNTPGNKF